MSAKHSTKNPPLEADFLSPKFRVKCTKTLRNVFEILCILKCTLRNVLLYTLRNV